MPDLIQSWDLSTLMALRSCHDAAVVWLAWVVASLSWKGVTWWLMAAVFWIRGQRQLACQFGAALLLGTLEIIALKGLILRPRPDMYAAQQLNIPMPELLPTMHSFPSGHTLLAAAIAWIVISRYRDWRGWLMALFVGMVAVARVFQGMHWPTDVLGSVVLGLVAGWAACRACQIPAVARFATDRKKQLSVPASAESPARRTVATR